MKHFDLLTQPRMKIAAQQNRVLACGRTGRTNQLRTRPASCVALLSGGFPRLIEFLVSIEVLPAAGVRGVDRDCTAQLKDWMLTRGTGITLLEIGASQRESLHVAFKCHHRNVTPCIGPYPDDELPLPCIDGSPVRLTRSSRAHTIAQTNTTTSSHMY